MGSQQLLALPDDIISRVVFYKRDEVMTDLICCEVYCDDAVYFTHEEAAEWDVLILKLHGLPGFVQDWFAHVSQPPFERSEFVAFERGS